MTKRLSSQHYTTYFQHQTYESFQLQMVFSFPFLRANDLRAYLLIIRARSFLLFYTSGVRTQGQCTVGTKMFSRDCSTDSISCREWEKSDEYNIKTRQQIKKVRSKLQSTWIIIQSLPLLSLRCRTAIALMSHRCCYAVVAPAVATQSLLILLPLSLRCRSVVAPMSLCCCSAVALLPLLTIRCRCCRSCFRYTVTDAIAHAVTHGRCLKKQNQGSGFHR